MNLKPNICGGKGAVHYVDCYAFSLTTMMGKELVGTDSATSSEGTKGVRAFNGKEIIYCGKGTCSEVLAPYHAVKKFESHIVTEVEGEANPPAPNSMCLKTELNAPLCEDE